MINCNKIYFAYSDNKKNIFEDFSWIVQNSERWVILGPSGCGKTTLLYILAGLIFPHNGTVVINDKPLTRPRPESGLILQEYGLLPWATVRENCQLGVRIRKLYGADGVHAPQRSEFSTNSDIWVERLGLSEFADKYPSQLSGGQRQRAAIARTLTLNPDLLLMDEPFSSLDFQMRETMQGLTLSLVEEFGFSLILVTHSIEEAVTMGRKILILKEPPNREVFIIENPGSGGHNYRNSEEYSLLCDKLRQFLGVAWE